MNTLLRCLVIGSALLFLGLSDDPNEKADELYAQAAQLVESAKQAKSYSEALPLYEQAKDILERIVSQYAASTIAVGLVSGQTKISSVTLSEFRELGYSFRRYARAEQDPLSCALVVARTVQREYRRIEAVIDIARVFVKAGQTEQARLALSQALDLADAIHAVEDEYTKARALVDIAGEFVELGQPEKASPLLSRALDIANTYPRWEEASWAECMHEGEFTCGDFEPRSGTVALFTDIARGFVKAGQAEQAKPLFLQAFKLSDGIHWGFIRHSDVANIAHGLVEAGQVTQALDIAKTVRGENAAGVLATIARDLTKAGQVTQALDLVNALTEVYQKALALRAIMDELAEVGQAEQAKPVLTQLLDLANTFTEREYNRPWVLAAIARELAKAGQAAQVLDLVSALKKEYQKAEVLPAIARELAKAGQVTQALDLVNVLKGEHPRSSILVSIVDGLTEAGQFTQALAIADTIKWERSKVSVLVTKAHELIKAGQAQQARSILSQALDAANAIKHDYSKAQVLPALAHALIKAGQAQQARSILSQALDAANAIKHDYSKAQVLADIARELTKAGQFSQALALANTIKEEDVKDSAVATVARVLTEAGQLTQALAVTKTIKDEYRLGYEQEYRKALALGDIASEFAKTGHQPSESNEAILREIVQAAIPMEKAWERIKKNEPG